MPVPQRGSTVSEQEVEHKLTSIKGRRTFAQWAAEPVGERPHALVHSVTRNMFAHFEKAMSHHECDIKCASVLACSSNVLFASIHDFWQVLRRATGQQTVQ
ncbi:hypothetical protein RRF57_009614 [Xylaria bambusicola]|uniref:Uncharacterized protein n=1 Tax=Xylaria bambusicola TaxID=326684 RepID=A0AAN7UJW9_9PEZI